MIIIHIPDPAIHLLLAEHFADLGGVHVDFEACDGRSMHDVDDDRFYDCGAEVTSTDDLYTLDRGDYIMTMPKTTDPYLTATVIRAFGLAPDVFMAD